MSDRDRSRHRETLDLLLRLERATSDDAAGAADTDEDVRTAGEELWALLNQDLEADERAAEARATRLRSRFYRELAAHQTTAPVPLLERVDRWLAGFWPGTRVVQAAIAACTLLVGLGLGLTFRRESEIQRLQREMTSMSQTVALALLDHSAATERLRGVSLGADALERGRDDQAALAIADGLLEVVGHDSSENVRLAAVEALARIADRPRIQAGLAQALPRQDSPLVQMELASLLVATGDGDAVAALRELLRRDDLEPAVRERLEELLRAAQPGDTDRPKESA